jgi:hypothetical protein
MDRMIAPVVKKKGLHQPETDFFYWQQQSYQARIAALEEIRREYHAWVFSQRKDAADVQPGFQRVYCIIKR